MTKTLPIYLTKLRGGRWLLPLLGLLLAVQVQAQVTVTGRVQSAEDQSAMPGVSILVKGSNSGTTTRADGTYSLSVPTTGASLIYSFIGFDSQEIPVGNRSMIDITLAAGTKNLNEVVVTALGIKKDVRNTGVTIQTVEGAQLLKAREPNPINSLTGKVAGLTIGASAELLGRPSVTLRGNQDVLFVVDGIPITSDTWNISADDIDTYTVLKGASASALYGFRGKNGAILITTKRGTKDKRGFSVEVNTSQMVDNGFIAIPKVQDEYGPGDHGVYAFGDGKGNGLNDGDYDIWGPRFNGQLIPQYDGAIVPGQSFTTTFPKADGNNVTFTSNRQPTPWVARGKDNLSRFIQSGILSNNNIAIAATGDKYDLRFSLSHNYQRGLVPNTKLNVTNFNITAGYNFSPKLRFESSLNYNRQYTPNYPDVSYGPNSLIYNVVIWGGADWNIDDMKQIWQPGKEGTQQIYAEYQRYNNPWFLAKYWERGHYNNNLYGYASLKYELADGLQLTGRIQATTYSLLRTEKFPYSATVYGREEARGDYREDRRNMFDNINQVLLQYNKKVTPDLTVSALAGGEARIFNYNSNYSSTNYLNVPGVYSLSNSSNPVIASNFQSDMRVLSAYYSADFTFRDFATLTTTGRLDKLSTLPKGNNAYFYPSVALSSVLSDYLPISQNVPAVTFVKLRASYANVKDGLTQSTIGSTPGASFPIGYGDNYSSSYGGPTYQNSAVYSVPLLYNNKPGAYYTNTLNNPQLKPNSTSQTEVGLDVRFLNNRLALDAAYYISNDGPRIFTLPSSEATGYTGQLANGIKTQKKGGEISLTGKVLRNVRGINWDIVANYSTYKETLKEVYPAGGITTLPSSYFVSSSSGARNVNIGDRTDAFYSGAFARTQDGQIINDYSQVKDANGIPVRDAAGNIIYSGGRPTVNPVAQFMGYVNPKFVWGINNRFSYKSWNFSFQFDGRVGGVIADYIKQKTYQGGRNIETVEGALGAARVNDVQGMQSYLSAGVVNIAVDEKGVPIPINYDVNGNITNYAQLKFAPNPLKTYAQDYIGRVYGQTEAFLISRTFAKLREVIVGYTLPQNMLTRVGVKQASISVVGRNLLYFAARKDLDLDQFVTGGYSGLQTPTTRRYGVNLNLTF